ncbi:MAG: GatB/YqeY domain-containing protein [Candidatus Nanopelagicales bacterium]
MSLKTQLQGDLSVAIKAQDSLVSGTLRLALSAITTEEVAGKQARELTDAEIVNILIKESKKRKEAAEAFSAANRQELADKELAEQKVLENYLPSALTEAEVDAIIKAAIEEAASTGSTGMKAMGAVMKIVQPQTAGRFDGSLIASKVKEALT